MIKILNLIKNSKLPSNQKQELIDLVNDTKLKSTSREIEAITNISRLVINKDNSLLSLSNVIPEVFLQKKGRLINFIIYWKLYAGFSLFPIMFFLFLLIVSISKGDLVLTIAPFLSWLSFAFVFGYPVFLLLKNIFIEENEDDIHNLRFLVPPLILLLILYFKKSFLIKFTAFILKWLLPISIIGYAAYKIYQRKYGSSIVYDAKLKTLEFRKKKSIFKNIFSKKQSNVLELTQTKDLKDLKNTVNSEKIEIAKNLLKEGVDIDVISKSTGLSKEEIEKLKE
jgi:hypothetical protein